MNSGNRSQGGWSIFAVLATVTVIGSVAGAYYVPKFAPPELMEQVLKVSAYIVGIVWALSYQFFTKLTEVTETAGLDHRQHSRLESVVRVRVRRFWLGSGLLLICGVVLAIPSVLTASKIAVPKLLWPLCILALGCCVVLLARTIRLSEELRAFRSEVKENERREKERAEQLAELKKVVGDGWERDPQYSGFRGE